MKLWDALAEKGKIGTLLGSLMCTILDIPFFINLWKGSIETPGIYIAGYGIALILMIMPSRLSVKGDKWSIEAED